MIVSIDEAKVSLSFVRISYDNSLYSRRITFSNIYIREGYVE